MQKKNKFSFSLLSPFTIFALCQYKTTKKTDKKENKTKTRTHKRKYNGKETKDRNNLRTGRLETEKRRTPRGTHLPKHYFQV